MICLPPINWIRNPVATCVHNAHEEFLPISATLQDQQDAVPQVVSARATRPAQPSAWSEDKRWFQVSLPQKMKPKKHKK